MKENNLILNKLIKYNKKLGISLRELEKLTNVNKNTLGSFINHGVMPSERAMGKLEILTNDAEFLRTITWAVNREDEFWKDNITRLAEIKEIVAISILDEDLDIKLDFISTALYQNAVKQRRTEVKNNLDQMPVQDIIRMVRKTFGITNVSLSKLMGLSQNMLGKYERNEVRCNNIKKQQLINWLINPHSLLNEVEAKVKDGYREFEKSKEWLGIIVGYLEFLEVNNVILR